MSDETLGGPVSGSFVAGSHPAQAHEPGTPGDGPAQPAKETPWVNPESGAAPVNAGIPAPTPGKSSEKPKQNRSRGAPRGKVARRDGPALAATVATMSAQGMGLQKIGRAIQRDWKTVRTILGRAETQKMIADYREFLKGQALSEALEIQTDGFKWVKETMAKREAKEFDSVTRGMSNLERIYASASGENAKVQVAQINVPSGDVHGEVLDLLKALMPPKA